METIPLVEVPVIDVPISEVPIFTPDLPLFIDEDRDLGVVNDPQKVVGYLNETDTTDVFSFSLNATNNLNLALTKITAGDDADLSLYKDVNGNGVLDKGIDSFIGSSSRGSNADEAINLQAQTAGTYFAEVMRYAPGSIGSVRYNLSLSATPPGPFTTSPSNLLPTEVEVANLSDSSKTLYGSVGNSNTADVYHFSLGPSTYGYSFRLNLSGLSNDADVRLIKDFNSNGIVDVGEELARSQQGGTSPESISQKLLQGDYFVQVYQYNGDTSYQLDMSARGIIG
ncbi:PPC domain-containing protein [Aerosakkonemataceae cyanobacterium BLCC-F50]|uniref:PPC domain-containing protein n=1 Tax=Floridaenema flaviceps BLCC-F50 TaxID=3153642 RepID=A0ABV4Y314_9CYAN